jgi:transposase
MDVGESVLTRMIIFPQRRKHRFGEKVIMISKRTTDTYLSTEDVSLLLGFSVRTVTLWFNQWHETGGQQGIPGFKVGKSWRAERKEIEAWIERQKIRPVQAAVIPLRQAQ